MFCYSLFSFQKICVFVTHRIKSSHIFKMMESPSIFLGLILKIFRRACVQCAVFKKSLPNSIYRQTDYHHVFVLGFGMSNKLIFKFWQTNRNIDLLTGIMFWNMTWFDPSQLRWPRPLNKTNVTKEIQMTNRTKFFKNCLRNELQLSFNHLLEDSS